MATQLFDKESALARVGDDEELLAELASLFLADYPNNLRAMQEALAGGNPELMERAAHSLKGAAANFGAEIVVREAFELERMARQGDLSHANSNLQRLCAVMQQLDTELRPLVH
jgi:HPt (histidine-containing phosphotransfer) domain-containing protein